jgi:hypothetical protein
MEPISAVFVRKLCNLEGEYKVFLKPFWGGGHIVEVDMVLLRMDFESLNVPMFDTGKEAYDYADLQFFGPQPEFE